MKHRREIVTGLSSIMIVVELLTVILPLFDKTSDTNETILESNNTKSNLVKDEGSTCTFGAITLLG